MIPIPRSEDTEVMKEVGKENMTNADNNGSMRAEKIDQIVSGAWLRKKPTKDPSLRIREHKRVCRLLQEAVEADHPRAMPIWGKYTYKLDRSVPG